MAVAAAYCGPCASIVAGVASAQTSMANGGNLVQGLQAGARSYVTSYISANVADAIGARFPSPEGLDLVKSAFSHGMLGGVMAELQGGKFGHGFASAFGSKFIGESVGLKDLITEEDIGSKVSRTMIAGIIGGSISKATGGKFANGARQAAIQWAFNAEGRSSTAGTRSNPIGYRTSNSMPFQMEDGKYYWVDKEMFGKNFGTDFLAKQTGETFADYSETTPKEIAKAFGYIGTGYATFATGGAAYFGWALLGGAAWLDPSPQNIISAATGPMGKGLGVIDDVVYPGSDVLESVITNVGRANDALTLACDIPKVCL